MATTDLRYPIGTFVWPASLTPAERKAALQTIADTPGLIRSAIQGLTDSQLDTPYRPEGWTVRQVVHHVPDSHLNAYTRFKLALTNDVPPRINAYDENKWVALPDVRLDPAVSVQILDGIHQRWVTLIRALPVAEYAREYEHPENGRMALHEAVALYAWHGRHHVGHISALRERRGW